MSFILPTLEKEANQNSNAILSYVQKNPGSHLREIKKDLSISLGTLRYHLEHLEKMGKITSERNNLHRHYFVAGFFKEDERNVLKMLNKKTSREIILFIMERKNPSLKDIVRNSGMSYASVTWHMQRLVDLGIILKFSDGRYRKYHMALSNSEIANLLKIYYPQEWNDWTNNLVNRFLSL